MTIIWPVGGEGNETEDVKTERKKRQKLPRYELHTYIHTCMHIHPVIYYSDGRETGQPVRQPKESKGPHVKERKKGLPAGI